MHRTKCVSPIALSIGFATLLVALSASTACRREVDTAAQSASAVGIAARTVTIPVDGMICQVCAGRVKSTLRTVHGVENAEISLEKRSAVIRYEPGQVGPDQLTRAINELGYKAGVPRAVEAQ